MQIKEAFMDAVQNSSDKTSLISVSEFSWAVSRLVSLVQDQQKNLVISKRNKAVAVLIPFSEYQEYTKTSKNKINGEPDYG